LTPGEGLARLVSVRVLVEIAPIGYYSLSDRHDRRGRSWSGDWLHYSGDAVTVTDAFSLYYPIETPPTQCPYIRIRRHMRHEWEFLE
jgi:hypothetical protein